MTIIEALKKSDRVRREYWIPNSFIFWKENRWRQQNGLLYEMSPTLILATDWQPYEPEKEKCEACKEAEEPSTPYLMEKHLRQFHCQCKGDK